MTARLWDLATGQLLRTFAGHSRSVKAVTFSPNGKSVLTGSRDGTARLWDLASGAPVQTYMGHTNTVLAAAISGEHAACLYGMDVAEGVDPVLQRHGRSSLLSRRHDIGAVRASDRKV